MSETLQQEDTAPSDDPALVLIENGYEPVVVAGKRPVAAGWQKGEVTPERIAEERRAHPEAQNTGLRTGRLVGVDIDIRDGEHTEAIASVVEDCLGFSAYLRIGAKGGLRCYRNEQPIKKITITAEVTGKRRTQVEILGEGQQFVAYGLHPDTGNSYDWPNAFFGSEPLQAPLAELPEVTPEQLRDCAHKIASELTVRGFANAKVSIEGGAGLPERPAKAHRHTAPQSVEVQPLPSPWSGQPISPDLLRVMLSYIDPTYDGASGQFVGIAKAVRWGEIPLTEEKNGDWWKDILDDWCSGELWRKRTGDSSFMVPTYKGRNELLTRIDKPREGGSKITLGTIIVCAKASGYRGPVNAESGATDDASEHLLAQIFAETHGATLRYVDEGKHWLEFDGQRWRTLTTPSIWNRVNQVIGGYTSATKGLPPALARKLCAQHTTTAVEQNARSRMEAYPNQWDADPWLLNTPGGALDLRTGKIRPNAPGDFCTKSTAIAPGGECPLWLKFLDRTADGDEELQRYLQRFLGYCLTGQTSEHVLAFCFGIGANGKSVLVNTVTAILGDYATSAPAQFSRPASTIATRPSWRACAEHAW